MPCLLCSELIGNKVRDARPHGALRAEWSDPDNPALGLYECRLCGSRLLNKGDPGLAWKVMPR